MRRIGAAGCSHRVRSLLATCWTMSVLISGAGALEARASGDESSEALPAVAAGSALARTLPDLENGARIFRATGGCTCHTNYPGEGNEAPPLAGGRALETPFGVFYSTNITPDPETGIGGWSEADFVRAMREGLSPEGEHYFPVFPYTAFSGLSDRDLVDMKAYLDAQPSIRRENRPPEAPFPFTWRPALAGWKWLNFVPRRLDSDPDRSEAWHRGRYLVEAAAHCGECHTPRTLTGGLDTTLSFAGSLEGPEGQLAPNITPDPETGIGAWTKVDLVWYLEMGLKPDGDDTQGLMAEVIEHGYAELPAEDLEAIAEYLASVPAIRHRLRTKRPGDD